LTSTETRKLPSQSHSLAAVHNGSVLSPIRFPGSKAKDKMNREIFYDEDHQRIA
jgi:hypothetical protein